MAKYGNKRTNGFASKKEAARYEQLAFMQKVGVISNLNIQVPYEIRVNGFLVCKYIADFTYDDKDSGTHVVEDAKGFRNPLYRLKAKLMQAVYGIKILEV